MEVKSVPLPSEIGEPLLWFGLPEKRYDDRSCGSGGGGASVICCDG